MLNFKVHIFISICEKCLYEACITHSQGGRDLSSRRLLTCPLHHHRLESDLRFCYDSFCQWPFHLELKRQIFCEKKTSKWIRIAVLSVPFKIGLNFKLTDIASSKNSGISYFLRRNKIPDGNCDFLSTKSFINTNQSSCSTDCVAEDMLWDQRRDQPSKNWENPDFSRLPRKCDMCAENWPKCDMCTGNWPSKSQRMEGEKSRLFFQFSSVSNEANKSVMWTHCGAQSGPSSCINIKWS